MTSSRILIAASWLPLVLSLAHPVCAQDATPPQEDPIEAAIRDFNERRLKAEADAEASNEIQVVLEPEAPAVPKPETIDPQPETPAPTAPADAPSTDKVEPAENTPAPDQTSETSPAEASVDAATAPQEESKETATTSPASPVLVTGKPPESIDLSDVPVAEEDTTATLPPPSDPPARTGLEVHVENIQAGAGVPDPAQLKLLTPFPPKPLIPPPAGWKLEVNHSAPPFKREVQLVQGQPITLTIPPHVLVPDANGANTFAIAEPGFQASQGYDQPDTVSGVLSESIHQLDKDSQQLGKVIDRLQQLIVSLPKAETNRPAPKSKVPTR